MVWAFEIDCPHLTGVASKSELFFLGCLESDRRCGDPWTRIDLLPLCEFSLLLVNDASFASL